MLWEATANVQRFDEAVAWFRGRFPLTQELADALNEYAGDRAWTVSGVAQLDIVLDTYEQLLKAIEDGTPFEDFKKAVEENLTAAWGKPDAPRIATVFRTNVQSALNAGRWVQLQDPEVKALRPNVRFDAIDDHRITQVCKECNGTVVDIDSAWAKSHVPPLHFNCRSQLVSVRASVAKTQKPPAIAPPDGFGQEPTAPAWEPKASDYPDKLFAEYKQKRADLAKHAPRKMVKA